MSSLARIAGLLAVAALLVLGAAGLSGHLVAEDPCPSGSEGSSSGSVTTWNPPGLDCVLVDGTVRRSHLSGSWPAFLGALAFGLAAVGLALRRWPTVPTWLRFTAGTTLTFALGGALAIEGGVQFMVVGLFYLGVPYAITVDWALRGGDAAWISGIFGALVSLPAAALATLGYLFGFGAAPYAVTVLLVAAVTALPWRRLPPRRLASS